MAYTVSTAPRRPDALGDEFAATLLSEEEFVCALPVGHELASRDHVTFAELAGRDLVTYRENSALHHRLELDDDGVKPRNAFIRTEMGAVRALVSTRARVQGHRRRGDPALGRRRGGPADRAAADRARSRSRRRSHPCGAGAGASRRRPRRSSRWPSRAEEAPPAVRLAA